MKTNRISHRYPLLALFLVLCLLAACQGAASPAGQPASDKTALPGATLPATDAPLAASPTVRAELSSTAAPELPALEEPIIWYLRGTAPADLARVNDQLNRLLEACGFNARVELRVVAPIEFESTLAEVQKSGAAWDLVSLTGAQYQAWVQTKDWLLPLSSCSAEKNNLLAQQAPHLWHSLPPALWTGLCQSGPLYALPNQMVWSAQRGAYLRADVVSALQLQPELNQVRTFRDLTPILAKIQAALKDSTLESQGVADAKHIRSVVGQADLLLPENAGYDRLVSPFVARYDDALLQPVAWPLTAEFKELATLRREWQQVAYLPENPLTPDDAISGYRAGRYVVEVGRAVWADGAHEQSNRFGYEWVSVPLGPSFLSRQSVLASVTGLNVRLAESNRRLKRVLLFLDLLHSDEEIYNLLVYGIEGQHWRWVDQSQKLISLAAGSGYLPDYADQIGDQTLSYVTQARQVGQWEAVRQANASAPVSISLGFAFDPQPVPGEVFAMQGLLPEMLDPLADGQARDVDAAIQLISRNIEAAGGSALEAELSQQLKEWKAAK